MSVVHNPLPLELEELFPKPEEFIHHQSVIHGPAHVARVIYHSLRLCRNMGRRELTAPLWAAAYIHDLARRADGVCHHHGQWAIEELWDTYVPKFRAAGVTPDWDDKIKEAVINHCHDQDLPESHPAHLLAWYLKDADALDRFRLGPEEGPDPQRLRTERARTVMHLAKRFFNETGHYAGWKEIWDKGVELYNAPVGLADELADNPTRGYRARDVRDRRLRQARFVNEPPIKEMLEWLSGTEDNAALKALLHENQLGIVDQIATDIAKRSLIATAMPTDAANKFLAQDDFLSFWELQHAGLNGWHDTYSDRPTDSRALTDKRLYGEKANRLCHAALIHPSEVHAAEEVGPLHILRRNYGQTLIIWDRRRILEEGRATFCGNDSQGNLAVYPLTENALYKTSVVTCVMAVCKHHKIPPPTFNLPGFNERAPIEDIYKVIVGTDIKTLLYWEIQLHGESKKNLLQQALDWNPTTKAWVQRAV